MPPFVNRLLPSPERYFPIENGRYEVKPGLRRFTGKVFEIDSHFAEFRRSKLSARAEQLSKYYAVHELTPDVERAFNHFTVNLLVQEHPKLFALDGSTLKCTLTADVLHFSPDGYFLGADGGAAPPYASGLDALASQVPEDIAIISTSRDGQHWLSALHLCSPNHWSAEEKIGKTFAAIHEPVAGIQAINRRETEWVGTMVNAVDGLVRFAWGVATDRRLNHHSIDGSGNRSGRRFDRSQPSAFLRVERQTIWGLPLVGASLFTIRTSFIDCAQIRSCDRERESLVSAIRSMTAESLRYKGIDGFKDDLLTWLESST